MISNDDVICAIDAYCARFPEQENYVRDLRKLIVEGARCLQRDEFRGHVTCSALVTNANDEVLMIHHRALDRWLLPGGHVEVGDVSLSAAAMRELSEETGMAMDQISAVAEWTETPVHIDQHTIPANPRKGEPEHEHWDFCYVFRITGSIGAMQESEVIDVKWREASKHSQWLASTIICLTGSQRDSAIDLHVLRLGLFPSPCTQGEGQGGGCFVNWR